MLGLEVETFPPNDLDQLENRLMRFDVPIDTHSGVPFYRQIMDRVMLGIADGTLATGDRLPTVRSLAVGLKVNPNTVARAYRDLELVGVVKTQRGSGTFIATMRPKIPGLERVRQLERLCAEVLIKTQGLGFSIDELIETLRTVPHEPKDASNRSANPLTAARAASPKKKRLRRTGS